MKTSSFLSLLGALWFSGNLLAADKLPEIPDFKKKLTGSELILSNKEQERVNFYFATDDSIEIIKKKLKKILGEKWVELPAEDMGLNIPEGVTDPFKEAKLNGAKPPAIIGQALFVTGKKIQWHLQVVLEDSPSKGKKHTLDISVFRMRLEKKSR